MTDLTSYVRTHLAGSAAGTSLFARGIRGQQDPDAAAALREIHAQLLEERAFLLSLATELGTTENRLMSSLARIGERVGRLKPNGHLLRRTPKTDLVELEAMRSAVAGKIPGWDALLAIADDHGPVVREQVESLLAQAQEQYDRLRDLHTNAATRALSTGKQRS